MAITGSQLVAEAEKLGKGASYVYGGTGPSGYDCSGLVQAALTALGIKNVPRTSEEQYAWATPVSTPSVGDLVFAQFPGDGTSPGHVGIYVGGGEVYSAQDPSLGIGLASLTSWKGNIVGYGKPPGITTSGTSSAASGAASGTSSSKGTSSGSSSGASAVSASDLSSLIAPIQNLLHAVATVIDYTFSMFEPGQGLRLLFAMGAGIMAFLSYRILAGSGTVPRAGI